MARRQVSPKRTFRAFGGWNGTRWESGASGQICFERSLSCRSRYVLPGPASRNSQTAVVSQQATELRRGAEPDGYFVRIADPEPIHMSEKSPFPYFCILGHTAFCEITPGTVPSAS